MFRHTKVFLVDDTDRQTEADDPHEHEPSSNEWENVKMDTEAKDGDVDNDINDDPNLDTFVYGETAATWS